MNRLVLLFQPTLVVGTLVIHTLVFIAPLGRLRNFGLASITPTTTDGPRISMGVLGSCARRNSATKHICTGPSLSSNYDLSVIPKADALLFEDIISFSEAAAICTCIVFTVIFLISLALRAWLLWNRKDAAKLKRGVLDLVARILGFLALCGIAIYALISVKFAHAIMVFNKEQVLKTRNQVPSLIASHELPLTMVWVGYLLLAISFIILLLDSWISARNARKKDKKAAAAALEKTDPDHP